MTSGHGGQVRAMGGFIERCSLEYAYAFDLCAVELSRAAGKVALFASSPFCARELVKRLDCCEAKFVPTGDWFSSSSSIQELLGPEVDNPHVETIEWLDVPFQAIAWAEPTPEDGEKLLRHIHELLAPGGCLCIVQSGWLARHLREHSGQGGRLLQGAVGLRQINKWLRRHGFTVMALYGFHSPRSVLWSHGCRLMERIGRGDLADRFYFSMRSGYVVRSWQAVWTPVRVTVARKQ